MNDQDFATKLQKNFSSPGLALGFFFLILAFLGHSLDIWQTKVDVLDVIPKEMIFFVSINDNSENLLAENKRIYFNRYFGDEIFERIEKNVSLDKIGLFRGFDDSGKKASALILQGDAGQLEEILASVIVEADKCSFQGKLCSDVAERLSLYHLNNESIFVFVEKNIIFLAKSSDLIKQFIDVRNGNQKSLREYLIDQQWLISDNRLDFYFQNKHLTDLLTDLQPDCEKSHDYSQLILQTTKILQKNEEIAHFGLKEQDGGIFFQTHSSFLLDPEKKTTSRILGHFPKDSLLIMKLSNVSDFLNNLETLLDPKEKLLYFEIKDLLAKKYDLVISDRISDLELSLILDEKTKKYKFILAMPKSDDLTQIIEQTAKNIFAWEFPQEQKLILPDSSNAIGFVANPKIFEFEKSTDIRFLRQENLEFGIWENEQNIVFSNSLEILQQTINGLSSSLLISVKEIESKCKLSSSGSFIYVLADSVGLSEFGEYLILSQQGTVDIQGCFLK